MSRASISPYVFQGIAMFEKLFAAMDDALAGGAPWLVGNDLSLGDINVMPFGREARLSRHARCLDRRSPECAALVRRAQAVPGFARRSWTG